MPQLDKMNWLFILSLLVFCIMFLLVIFIKRNFYSWKKLSLLKVLTIFQISEIQGNNILFPFLALNGQFLQQRKLYFNNLNVGKTVLFADTLHQLDKNIQQK